MNGSKRSTELVEVGHHFHCKWMLITIWEKLLEKHKMHCGSDLGTLGEISLFSKVAVHSINASAAAVFMYVIETSAVHSATQFVASSNGRTKRLS